MDKFTTRRNLDENDEIRDLQTNTQKQIFTDFNVEKIKGLNDGQRQRKWSTLNVKYELWTLEQKYYAQKI